MMGTGNLREMTGRTRGWEEEAEAEADMGVVSEALGRVEGWTMTCLYGCYCDCWRVAAVAGPARA